MLKRLIIIALWVPIAALAQSYPSKPVRIVLPFGPGGVADITTRTIAPRMSEGLGQQVVVENMPGAGGIRASETVARADPDGYTLLITHIGSLALNPYLYSSLPFDVNRDFIHISLLAKVPNIFVVHESVPAKDAREFVALAKKEPGKYYYGSAGNGSAGHLAMEYFKLVSGIELQHVPYKGTGPNLVDLVAGRTHATSAGTPPLMPHVKAGKLRVIGVGSPKRLATIPDAPTIAEQGFAGFETSQWYGLSAPAKTPPAVIQRLATEAAKAAQSPAVVERYKADDAEAIGSTPQEYANFVAKEQARWKDVIRRANIKID
jgi:tripartite-type tricarboxylate transporter receptor subunit TctC